MSIRNNACFNVRIIGFLLFLLIPNLVWSNEKYSHSEYESHYSNNGKYDHVNNTREGRFGLDSDLDSFNELEAVQSDNNYAEVVLENAILGDVTIDQASLVKGNKAKVIQDHSIRSEAYIGQYGGENTALITQQGIQNKAYIYQYGMNNDALISQDGKYNTAAIIQYGYGSSLSINQTGNNNQAYIVDKGGSNYGISQNGNDYVAVIGAYGVNVYVTQN